MKNVLDRIVEVKRKEVAELRSAADQSLFDSNLINLRDCLSLKERLLSDGGTGIIAEFKRKSPSKGWLKQDAVVADVVKAYEVHGAVAASILTDTEFFGGNLEDLSIARSNSSIPLLRKDFIIDEIQIRQARIYGADVILLIAAILSREKVRELAGIAKELGLEILLELHDESELEHICDEVDMIGINNRNLKNFEVDIERSLRMSEQIPNEKVKIAESGISSVETIRLFRQSGFRGFLIGETFMKEADPGEEFKKFVERM